MNNPLVRGFVFLVAGFLFFMAVVSSLLIAVNGGTMTPQAAFYASLITAIVELIIGFVIGYKLIKK